MQRTANERGARLSWAAQGVYFGLNRRSHGRFRGGPWAALLTLGALTMNCGPGAQPGAEVTPPVHSVSPPGSVASEAEPAPLPQACGVTIHADMLSLSCERAQDLPAPELLGELRYLSASGALPSGAFAGLKRLQRLDLSRAPAESLAGLASASELTDLRLLELPHGDISAVGKLTKLRRLEVSRGKPVDLSPVSGLLGLRELHLTETEALSLEPLSELKELERVRVIAGPKTDLSPLSSLNLAELELDCRGGVLPASLAALKSVKRLTLNTLDEYSWLKVAFSLPALEELTLSYTTPKLDGIERAKKLRVLRFTAEFSSGTALVALRRATELEELELHNTRPADAKLLRASAKLRSLKLIGGEPELKALPALPKLTSLTHKATVSTDYSELSRFPKLEQLALDGYGVDGPVDLTHVARLTALEGLSLGVGEFENYQALSSLPLVSFWTFGGSEFRADWLPASLKQLSVFYLPPKEFSHLSKLVALRHLSLGSEPEADWPALTVLTGLQQLRISTGQKPLDLGKLAQLKQLRRLTLVTPRIVPGSLRQFQAALPSCEIVVEPS